MENNFAKVSYAKHTYSNVMIENATVNGYTCFLEMNNSCMEHETRHTYTKIDIFFFNCNFAMQIDSKESRAANTVTIHKWIPSSRNNEDSELNTL